MSRSPVVLGLDASTGACSVALAIGDEVRGHLRREAKGQAGRLLRLADALLAEAGLARTALDAVACTRGPGGFTGVRIGIGVAQGLALGLDRPAVALSTLQVVAETARARAPDAGGILALLDARMGEIYGGVYRHAAAAPGSSVALEPEWLGPPLPRDLPAGVWYGAGSGFAAYPALAGMAGLAGVIGDCLPDMAAAMPLARRRLEAGASVAAAELEPLYLRNRVADPPAS